MGGLPFDQSQQSRAPYWKQFRDDSLYVPEIMIEESYKEFHFHFASRTFLSPNLETATTLELRDENLTPNASRWEEMINESCQEITEGSYQKIVLSRYAEYKANGDVFTHLADKLLPQENSYTLLWAVDKNHIFLSQSPETLFKREAGTIYVDSLAGTIERGETQQQDQENKKSLLHNPKELEEHRYVTQFLYEKLTKLCKQVETTQKEKITELSHIQHLHTKLMGTLKENVSLQEILDTLHPTPAIGGLPQEGVKDRIYNKELFDRGYYSAPIGFFTQNECEFLVGIRSALMHEDTVKIYAGAGIVKQSKAQKEWQETAQKMKTMRNLL